MEFFSQEDIMKKIEQAYAEIYKNPAIQRTMDYISKNDKIQMQMNLRGLANLQNFRNKQDL